MNLTADRVVDALLAEHLLHPESRPRAVEVVATALGEAATVPSSTSSRGLPKLVEVVAYLGGALVLAAVMLFLVQEWGSLGFGSQVTLLAVATAVLLVAGLACAHVSPRSALLDPSYDVRRRLAGSLLSGAALTAGSLAGLVVDHADPPTSFDWETFSGGAVVFVVAALGYLRAKTAVGVLVLMGSLLAVVLTVSDRLDQVLPGSTESDGVAYLLLVTGIAWLVVAELGWFREGAVARVLGILVVLVGAQVPVLDGRHEWLGYLLTGACVVAGVAMYLTRQSWPYLALAVVGVTLVVPEAISDWTEGSLGIVGGVLVTGVTLLLASFAGYRLRAESVA